SSTFSLPDFAMPIGLLELAAYVRKHMDNVKLTLLDVAKDLNEIYTNYDSTPPMTLDTFVERELNKIDFKPNVIGISILYSTSHKGSLKILEAASEKWPGVPIICGGNHATTYYKFLLKQSCIDYVLRGEGEISFVEFLNVLRKRDAGNYKDINVYGIYDCIKAESGVIEISKMIYALDEIPIAAYDLLDLDYYRSTSNSVGKGAVSLMFDRGCIYKCTFCATRIVHGESIRSKSNERIMDELRYVKNVLKFKRIIIQDDLFAAKRKKFLELHKMILDERICEGITFCLPNALCVAIMNEEVIDALISMGAEFIKLSIESGSSYTQKHIIHKNVPLDKAKRLLEYLRKKDISIEVNFILGFPNETRELMQETIDYIDSLDVDWVIVYTAVPLPGTRIFQEFVNMGVISIENYDWDICRFPLRSFDTNTITAKDLEDLVYDTNIFQNFLKNKNIKYG
ncbi:MAG: radical SAM protein, partial [Nanoarchaeota archaeon]